MIYELQQAYELKMPAAASVTLRAPRLYDRLYENALEAQLMMVFDCNKQLVGTA
jgi:hypothetical protein